MYFEKFSTVGGLLRSLASMTTVLVTINLYKCAQPAHDIRVTYAIVMGIMLRVANARPVRKLRLFTRRLRVSYAQLPSVAGCAQVQYK